MTIQCLYLTSESTWAAPVAYFLRGGTELLLVDLSDHHIVKKTPIPSPFSQSLKQTEVGLETDILSLDHHYAESLWVSATLTPESSLTQLKPILAIEGSAHSNLHSMPIVWFHDPSRDSREGWIGGRLNPVEYSNYYIREAKDTSYQKYRFAYPKPLTSLLNGRVKIFREDRFDQSNLSMKIKLSAGSGETFISKTYDLGPVPFLVVISPDQKQLYLLTSHPSQGGSRVFDIDPTTFTEPRSLDHLSSHPPGTHLLDMVFWPGPYLTHR